MAATDTVFNTPELLEMILLNIPHPHRLLFQRVNRFWRAITASSAKLQRWTSPKPIANSFILFNVLLRLPLRDLVVVQRISRAFKELVEASPKLRKALSMEPYSDIVARITCRGFNQPYSWMDKSSQQQVANPLLNPFLNNSKANPAGLLHNGIIGLDESEWSRKQWLRLGRDRSEQHEPASLYCKCSPDL